VGEVAGVSIPKDSVRYPKEYAVHPVDQELKEIKEITDVSDKWPGMKDAMTSLIKRKFARIAIADVGHLEEIEQILTDIAAYGEKTDDELPDREPLNGAQVTAIFTGIEGVAAGALPRDAVQSSFQISFGLSEQEADAMLGSAGKGFVPAAQISVEGGIAEKDGEQEKQASVAAEGSANPKDITPAEDEPEEDTDDE
jgi:hypothetical protein